MKLSKTILLQSIFILLLVATQGYSQIKESKGNSREFLVHAAKDIIIAAGNCALITLDEEGLPRARVMDPFTPENDLTIWFGTNSKSRKVYQIRKNPKVTLYYFDSKTSAYVMIQGNAELVNDPKEKNLRWKERWSTFYPNRSESYLLIKVTPIWMEVLSNSKGIYGDSITWQPPRVLFDSKQ